MRGVARANKRRAVPTATILGRSEVDGITSSLTVQSRVGGSAHKLRSVSRQAFLGSFVLGKAFVLSKDEAQALLEADARNADVVQPYLVGEDLNQRPDCSPSRWVINFRDWSEARARQYHLPFERVETLVRPERAKSNREAYRRRWWQFAERATLLYPAIAALDRCIALTLISNVVQPAIVPTGMVYAHKLCVFAFDDSGHFGLLSSGVHSWWAVTRGSTMRTDVNYSPTDCFGTFVQPEITDEVADIAADLHAHRSALQIDRQEGLTNTYKRVHDRDEHADDIADLRELHMKLDYAVRDAYGWTDLDLGHGFHETKVGMRYTFAPDPRQEVLDRLLELNQERFADEVAQGLHSKPKTKGRRKSAPAGSMAMELDGA